MSLKEIEEQIIYEWKDYYVDYKKLLEILQPLKEKYINEDYYLTKSNKNIIKINKNKIENDNDLTEKLIDKDDNNEIENKHSRDDYLKIIKQKFLNQLKLEFEKFQFFTEQLYNNRHITRYEQILEQLEYIKKHKEYKIFEGQIERTLKNFYKDVSIFQKFIETNQLIKNKIIGKYLKYLNNSENNFSDLDDNETEKVLTEIDNTVSSCYELNKNFLNEIEKRFSFYFHSKYNMSPLKVLKNFLSNVIFSQTDTFFLGIYIGILFILFLTCIILGKKYNLDFDDDAEFRSLFPMFRTYGILCLYLWTLGSNVWAWNEASINYKALFAFDNHYSTTIEIFQRSAFFTIIFFISLLIYILMRSKIEMFVWLNTYISVSDLPLICWLVILIYFFCPFKIFNYEGRIYTMGLFIECIASIFIPIEFRHIWFMDQLTSLIGPMRDIEYTLCYYSYYHTPYNQRESFCGNTRGIYLVIGIFPNFIRCLQVGRQIIDKGKVFPYVFNIGKYTFNIIVCVFSFLTNFYQSCFYFWIISAFISGCYSSFWDNVMDWGFFERGSKNFMLRNNLTYKNKFFYQSSIFIDIILRFLWVLSVSPEIMANTIRPEFLALILYTLEMFRRGLWNFIRVEFEHLDLIKAYQISYYEELPFVKEENGLFFLNEHNLINILNLNKYDKIKIEIKEIFKSGQKIKKIKNIQSKSNQDAINKQITADCIKNLKEYIIKYRQNTEDNLKS